MDDLAEFGRRLKEVMERRGETATTLSAKLSLSPQAIHKWLGGKEISLPNLRAVASALDVNWIWLRYGETMPQMPVKFKSDEDISKLRQKLFDEVAASDKRRRWALERLGIGLYESDLVKGERTWGPYALKLLGLPWGVTPTPASLADLLGVETAAALEELGRKAAAGGRHYLQVGSNSRPGVLFEVCMELIMDEDYRPQRLYAMFRPLVEGGVSLRRMIEEVEELQ